MTNTSDKMYKIVVHNNHAWDKENPIRASTTNSTHQLLMITRNNSKFVVMLYQIMLLKQNTENNLAHWNTKKKHIQKDKADRKTLFMFPCVKVANVQEIKLTEKRSVKSKT